MRGSEGICSGIQISKVTFRYGQRVAIDNLSLQIPRSRIFAILGPNGSGKSTLFRLLATLIPLQAGDVNVFGFDLRRECQQVRLRQGVVFQSPSLDKQLTILENLRQQAALYGVTGSRLINQAKALLDRFGIADLMNQRCEKLSGGQRRRVELAKCLLHEPELLILDEPSTGLDPVARIELMKLLTQLQQEQGTTIVLTTHLLEEADRADEIAIMDQGKVVAQGAPVGLKSSIGGDTIELETPDPKKLTHEINERFSLNATVVDHVVRLETREATRQLARIMEAFGDHVETAKIAKPSLEDVFIAKTGRRLLGERSEVKL